MRKLGVVNSKPSAAPQAKKVKPSRRRPYEQFRKPAGAATLHARQPGIMILNPNAYVLFANVVFLTIEEVESHRAI